MSPEFHAIPKISDVTLFPSDLSDKLNQELTESPCSDKQKGRAHRLIYKVLKEHKAVDADAPKTTFTHSLEIGVYFNLLLSLLKTDGDVSLTKTIGKENLNLINIACLLHDLGKSELPPEIQDYKKVFNQDEINTVREHSILGAKYASLKKMPDLVQKIISDHHERHDGSGYPDGLIGDQIGLVAKIVGLLDATQAAIVPREHNNNGSGSVSEELEDILCKFGGKERKFDPRLKQAYRLLADFLSEDGVVNYIHQRAVEITDKFSVEPFDPSDFSIISAPTDISREVIERYQKM